MFVRVATAFLPAFRLHAFLLANEGFIDFNNAAFPPHETKLAGAHSLSDAVREEPGTLDSDLQHTGKLITGNVLLLDHVRKIACNHL